MKRQTFNTILIILFAISSIGIVLGKTELIWFCKGFSFMITIYVGYEVILKKLRGAGKTLKIFPSASIKSAKTKAFYKHDVTLPLPLSNTEILKGMKDCKQHQLPKDWLNNEDTNSNYMAGFLNAVKWMEGNAR